MKNTITFELERKFDIICLGRAAVDLYAQDIGSNIEDSTTFAKYLGGSSANIAFGTARLGLRSSMLTRVGNEQMGEFVANTLKDEGCDISHIVTDPSRLTGLVILSIKDKNTFPLLFYRENCADMALCKEDFTEKYIASSKSLLITGTHFSQHTVWEASKKALQYAQKNNTKTILDIDYRPVLWGLTSKKLGEERFIESQQVTEKLQSIIPFFDLIVGTEEEFHILGGNINTMECLHTLSAICKKETVFVVKRGALGCTVFQGDIPAELDEGFSVKSIQVEVLNVLGAGDAFMSGFLFGWLQNKDYSFCCLYANICGALVVTRHACSAAMPTKEELFYYLENKEKIQKPSENIHLKHLHRIIPSKNWENTIIINLDSLCLFGKSITQEQIPAFIELKKEIIKAFFQLQKKYPSLRGVCIDDLYQQDLLNILSNKNIWTGRIFHWHQKTKLPLDHINLVDWYQNHTLINSLECHNIDDYLLEQLLILEKNCQKISRNTAYSLVGTHEEIEYCIQRAYSKGIKPFWWVIPPCNIERIYNLIKKEDPFCKGIIINVKGTREDIEYIHSYNPFIKSIILSIVLPVESSYNKQNKERYLSSVLQRYDFFCQHHQTIF